ncbi:MAG: glycosyltransferase family 1 protein [Rhodobacterales bacterium]|nr:glycosyltransferase family 1 protein [Rhodobacterales bacterium]
MTTPAARLLDLTRLISRAGRTPTGIDRVERAWLRALIAEPIPVFGLIRTNIGYLLLDGAGLAALDMANTSGRFGTASGLSRLSRKASPATRAAESFARRHAIARALPFALGPMLKRHLPSGTAYINVGHSNLTDRVLTTLRTLPAARITVMVHDTISLDWPQFQRDGTPVDFRAKLTRVSRHADTILCQSNVVREDLTRHLTQMGRCPPIVVAPLGVDLATPDPATELPPDPYFVILGTIEPRKNHALLLDLWPDLGPAPPTLVICGSRGWRNDAVFARLDAHPPGILERPCLPDAAVAALLANARALLFPSFAEGYGLPLLEAAALGTPIICSDLPITHELLGPVATYIDANNPVGWLREIRNAAKKPRLRPETRLVPPDWWAHFKIALSVT